MVDVGTVNRMGDQASVLHGWAGWRRGRSVTLLRILPSCRTNTMPPAAALVQRDRSGRSEPIRFDRLRDADGVGASGIDHAVEDSDADGCFDLLARQLSGMQVVTEDALVACHSVLHGEGRGEGGPIPRC